MMDVLEIMERIPHRYPFLLVDRVLEAVPGERIKALKNVTINEAFFQGHYPGHPIMPGVLTVEAMAQALGALMMEPGSTQLPFFSTVDNVKFRRPVKPGDQVIFDVEVLKIKGRIIKAKGVATVDGKVATEADLMFMLMDR